MQPIIAHLMWWLSFAYNVNSTNLWRLNPHTDKIVDADDILQHLVTPKSGIPDHEQVFNIITSTVHSGQAWIKNSVENCATCHTPALKSNASNTTLREKELSCGKSVNYTYYDNLVGVLNRHRFPIVPETPLAVLFYTQKDPNIVNVLERKLKKAKREKPKSIQLYNDIGNFWRLIGNAQMAIECFRRALAVAPHNAEVLLNLARLLFHLQYLDDAIYLTRRSMEVQTPIARKETAWQQYFTLGEILRAYGHYQEATVHLRHALKLKPTYEPAIEALKQIEAIPNNSVHLYTVLIIVLLVLAVFIVVLSTVYIGDLSELFMIKSSQKHLNYTKTVKTKYLRGFEFGKSGKK